MTATPDDPAIRLGIQISGTDTLGNAISFWLKSKGKQNILKMKTLVDEFEGKTDGGIGQTPRRWIAKNETRGRYKPSYTWFGGKARAIQVENRNASVLGNK